jgi:chemotaxis protein histidine kinase CheA
LIAFNTNEGMAEAVRRIREIFANAEGILAAYEGLEALTGELENQVAAQQSIIDANLAQSNTYKNQAATSASTATTKATEANTSASNAAASATTATTKANEANTSATNAASSASTATTKAAEANTSATKASEWAEKAVDSLVETGKYSAKHHATKAATSATTATTKAGEANISATNAATSATTATTKASEANTSATNAATSATTAATKAGEANTSAINAAASATTATTKAAEANTSATNAATSATTATTQAGIATTKATEAENWASAPENNVVSAGKYSALHYSLRAEYWSQQAAASVTGALIFIGGYNASSNSFPPGAGSGFMYRITTAGTLGPFDDGITRPVDVGDHIIKTASSWSFVDAMDQFIDASRINSGQFPLARLPRATSGFLRAKGAGVDPAYEALVAADIPNLDAAKITTGTLPVARGGTGAATLTGLVKGNGTGAMTPAVAGTDYVVPGGSITGNAGTASRLSEAIVTQGTSNLYQNQWTLAARISLSARYQDAGITLYVKSSASGSTTDQYDKVQFRAKQQDAFGQNPYVELLHHKFGDEAAVYGYVIVQNTPTTIVELYIQNKRSYNTIRAFELARAVSSGVIQYLNNEPYSISVPNLVIADVRTLLSSTPTKRPGAFDTGTTAPSNTVRINYDGHFYATAFYGNGANLTFLNAANVSSGQLNISRLPRAAAGVLKGKGAGADPAYEALTAEDIPELSISKITDLDAQLRRIKTLALAGL